MSTVKNSVTFLERMVQHVLRLQFMLRDKDMCNTQITLEIALADVKYPTKEFVINFVLCPTFPVTLLA